MAYYLRRRRPKEETTMLDIYSTEQKVSILTQIMREESTGASLRDCCKAQGITLQTFIDWKARAQKNNHLDARPTLKLPKVRQPKPPTALELALKKAQINSYPTDNPDDVRALEQGEPEPHAIDYAGLPEDNPEDLHAVTHGEPPAAPAPVAVSSSPPEPEQAASGPYRPGYPVYDAVVSLLDKEPELKPVEQSNDEVLSMATDKTGASRPRGLSAVLHQRMPWLAGLDKRTEKTMGPKPASKAQGYGAWIAHRKTLMTPEQALEMEDFYGINRRGSKTKTPPPAVAKRTPKPAQIEEQKEMVSKRTNANGSRPVSPEIEALAEQHAQVTSQIVQHERHGPRELSEIDKLKRALTALTIENLQLRGLL
jgi:hypothetical protein